MGFQGAADRLLQAIRKRIRAGELSERRLAKLADVSQPHMHNVLAGKRGLAPALADRLLRVLGLTLEDLIGPHEIAAHMSARYLTGPIGGGRAFPGVTADGFSRYFETVRLRGVEEPCLARIADEEIAMAPTLLPRDDILLDCGWSARKKVSLGAVYAIEWEGSSYLCRCRVAAGVLITATETASDTPLPKQIALGNRRVEDVVRGQVVWFGRALPPV